MLIQLWSFWAFSFYGCCSLQLHYTERSSRWFVLFCVASIMAITRTSGSSANLNLLLYPHCGVDVAPGRQEELWNALEWLHFPSVVSDLHLPAKSCTLALSSTRQDILLYTATCDNCQGPAVIVCGEKVGESVCVFMWLVFRQMFSLWASRHTTGTRLGLACSLGSCAQPLSDADAFESDLLEDIFTRLVRFILHLLEML